MFQLAAFLALCVLVSAWLRRRPDVASLLGLSIWVLLPAYAGELLTGVPYSAKSPANLHPAAWFVLIYIMALCIGGGRRFYQTIGELPGFFLLLPSIVFCSIFSSLLNVEASSPRTLLGILVAGCCWIIVSGVAAASCPSYARQLAQVIVVLATANAIVSFVQATASNAWPFQKFNTMYSPDPTSILTRTQGTVEHPLILSLLIVIAIPLCEGVRFPPLRYGLLVALFVALLQSGSRAGLIFGAAGAIYVLARSVWRRPVEILWVGVASALAVSALLGTQGAIVLLRIAEDARSSEVRLVAYDYFVQHWHSFILLGNGYGSSFDLKSHGFIQSSLENGYLMLAYDCGFISTVCLLLFIVFVADRGLRAGCWTPALSALLGSAICATFSSIETVSAAPVLFFASLGVCYASVGGRSRTGLRGPHVLIDADASSRSK